MDASLLQDLSAIPAGVFLVAVVYLVDKIIGWVKLLRTEEEPDEDALKSMVKKLYDMHNVRDRDQVPIWYVKQSLIDDIERILQAVETLKYDHVQVSNIHNEQYKILKDIELFHATGGCGIRIAKLISKEKKD